ncbi:hypothetical protein ACE6H2_019930 [Prunus campanulata]
MGFEEVEEVGVVRSWGESLGIRSPSALRIEKICEEFQTRVWDELCTWRGRCF